MPGVEAAVIDAVLHDWEAHRPWGAVTRYEDGLGHPLVFGAAGFADLRALHGDKAVWKLVEGQPRRVREVAVARPLPGDVDTWEDYEAACRRLGVAPAAEPATR
jgi:molybdenum cofactor cytidylyltransferase